MSGIFKGEEAKSKIQRKYINLMKQQSRYE